ncbi:LEAF RUST 10 DISEASE-RESISTANCE LOCUS RECEPTOR-LIKE PROTEIN KINASE-like 2.1 [Vicia villosa]|uniref:LEAF RUST 10 DISEASE-RESISTANCE LOCUS RECEPTOR-LIKE PROTEIN KINASE-like 2.1 n=1 Tax=Vicia villosa TaxID=3911 RepID=UPI00273BBAE8|nr:LEAF RUST 10 DISEASE-RESISTANCE LOCUS RECEPTOR-LIKE PROTEIN KINASE-like 2.1 [Vicia villosa]
MCREKTLSTSSSMQSILCFFKKFMVVVLLHQTCEATISTTNNQTYCPPSSCGEITNIKHPFRLKNDPKTCGDPRYEFSCENNKTTLKLFSGKYYVKSINYNNYTIRVVDAGIEENNCSAVPRYFLTASNFTSYYNYNYQGNDPYDVNYPAWLGHVIYLNCSKPVKNDHRYVYVDTSSCRINSTGHGYVYAIAGDIEAGRLSVDCRVKIVATSSASFFKSNSVVENDIDTRKHFTYEEIHEMLSYGFYLSWMKRGCEDSCDTDQEYCGLDEKHGVLTCASNFCTTPLGHTIMCEHMSKLRIFMEDIILGIVKGLLHIHGMTKSSKLGKGFSDSKIVIEIGKVSGMYLLPSFTVRFTLGLMVFFVLLIYTFGRRHISIYENIENFLRGNTLMPIRYSYRDIKKMTKSFRDKLGEGGFGSVYKGKLRGGKFVAIKMLDKSKGNGQDFISEVATIGRIHHANVVRLIGFCVEGSKRALVYEFMPNGSLDKYISSKEDVITLTSKKMYAISLGVARGIAYLHQGCDMQILHFDIKPHNILLDENFIAKVSDFGLAKLYPNNNSIVPLTAARGTIGYMAPELFYKNIGGVSYKADVYSFGMLLMEIASKRRNLNSQVDRSSHVFFPFEIYNQLVEEREIEMDEYTNEDKYNVKKMFITALWCIQLKPSDRPAMNKVIEMLEDDIKNIEMSPKPSLYPNEIIEEELKFNSHEIELEVDNSSNSFIKEDTTKPLMMNYA